MAEWIIMCNLSYYDIEGAFQKFDIIQWKQSVNIEQGDTIYIYVGKPASAIKYKCRATKVNLTENTIDDLEFVKDGSVYKNYGRYMELQLLEKYNNELLGNEHLKDNGLKSVQGPSKVNEQLSQYIRESTSNRKLIKYSKYSRKAAHDILDPLVPFTPQSGTWGLQGIISLSESKGDYVFFVTIGSSQAEHDFDEGITENGILTWQSQPKMDFDHKTVKNLISFDEKINSLYLFLRTKKSNDYSYLGKLAYLVHDFERSNPVHFKWKILEWDAQKSDETLGGLDVLPKIEIVSMNDDERKGVTTEEFNTEYGSKSIDKEAETLINIGIKRDLDSKIKSFQKWIETNHEKESEIEKKRQKFVEDYKIRTIIEMKKEEYVVGFGRHDTFCYRIETELKELGDIHGASSVKFGMYYGKSGEDTENKYRIVKSKFGDDPDKALEKIKEQIVNLILAGDRKDYSAIKACTLAPIFRGKILATYYPESYLCIFSKDHLEYFLNKLGLTYFDDENEFDKQLKLLKWKENNSYINSWPIHTYERFLYLSFGNPSEIGKAFKTEQEEKDKAYPKDYVTEIGVKIDQWKELLQNNNVFTDKNIELIKRIYLSENHAVTCYELGLQDGVSPSTFIRPVVELGRRISNKIGLNPIIGTDGKETFWRILFWGTRRENGYFEWKLRPKLAKALLSIYPELDLIKGNEIEDSNLVEDLRKTTVINQGSDFEYKGKPKNKQEPIYSNGTKTYPRGRQTALNALARAKYECEINVDHPTFKRKKTDVNYTEPHHLVPMAFSDQFEKSLDVEENIVSLCSNCHNQLHYGQGAEELLKILYDERKEHLRKAGINISLIELLEKY